MRIRTLATLSTGAALGAGAMYLMDPAHGEARRREAARSGLRLVRSGAATALVDGRRRAEALAVAAIAGYRQARAEAAGTVSPLVPRAAERRRLAG